MHIDPNTLIIWLLVGAIAGWLAGQVMRGGGLAWLAISSSGSKCHREHSRLAKSTTNDFQSRYT
jgi:hypothetical protein